jgi:hypothetical protein
MERYCARLAQTRRSTASTYAGLPTEWSVPDLERRSGLLPQVDMSLSATIRGRARNSLVWLCARHGSRSPQPRFDERLRPDPIIEGLWQQDPGFVWVLLRDADERWEPPAEANVMRSLTSHEYSRIYDWVLEAIDPEAGTVIAAKRFDDVLWFRPPTPLLTSRSRADTLNVTHNVWRADLMPKEVRTP